MLKKPWLQFALLGALLFFVNGQLFPEPKPVLGPPNAERLAAMAENYARFARGEPGAELRARFIDAELRDELLFREALRRDLQYRDAAVEQRIIRNMRFLDAQTDASDAELVEQGYALRLHLTDEVIRRRLVQIMERLIVATTPSSPPTAEDVQARYEQDLESWQEPARFSLSHVFLPGERANEMAGLMATVRDEQLTPDQARLLGAPFLSGYQFTRQSPDQLTRVFGAVFLEELEQLEPASGSWVGPVSSAFGVHYVFVEQREPPRVLAIDEVSERITRDLARESEASRIAEWVSNAMANYEVRRS
jgi:hypothetical protein